METICTQMLAGITMDSEAQFHPPKEDTILLTLLLS